MKLIKGNFIYSIDKDNIEIKENQYLLIKDGKAEEFYKELPSRLKSIEVEDYGDNIIIPGLIDLHIHFSKCDWDLHKVFEIIDTSKNITVETRKDKEACFREYEEDLKTLKEAS